jgi:hypothetical protein
VEAASCTIVAIEVDSGGVFVVVGGSNELGDDALVSRGGVELFRAVQIGRVDAVRRRLELLTFSSEMSQ